MSTNERKRHGIWAAARLVAVPVIALVLAGVALPRILDSGTGHIPAIGIGSGSGSGPSSRSSSGPPPVAKIAVSPPAAGKRTHQHPTFVPATSPAPAATRTPTAGGSLQVNGQAAESPVSRPLHQSTERTKQPTTPTHPSGGTGSGAPPPTNQPAPATGGAGDQAAGEGNQSPTPALSPRLDLGHQNHVPPGQARKNQNQPPPGLALGHRNHVPPGQARKDQNQPPPGLALGHRHHSPPGQARKSNDSRGHDGDDQDEDSRDDDSGGQDSSSHGHHGGEHDHSPPGHASGADAHHSHGRGRGH